MKAKISIITFLLALAFPSICVGNNDIKTFEIQFNRILNNLDSIIGNSECQHDIIVKHYEFIKDKINNKELPIAYDSTLNNDFYGCASFNILRDNNHDVNLSYGQFIVDKYESNPALIYGIIINTFQAAYDYYNNQELFLISTSNQIEKTYFEMDAMTIEAIFLKVYMKSQPNLGYFEKYLMADLSNNLYGTATLFKKTDLRLLHQIDKLKSEDKDADKLLKEFRQIGRNLIKNTTFDSGSKWTNYCSLITLKTYVYYSQQVIFDIMHLKDGISEKSFNIEDYSENYEVIREIQKIIGENNSFLSYHDETMELYADFYK